MTATVSWIRHADGGACVRDTRHTVWGLVEWRRLGVRDTDILRRHPDLSAADLEAAWEYAAAHSFEIERVLWENDVCMLERNGAPVPPDLVQRGLALGLSEAAIRDAFEPPLTAEEFQAAVGDNGRLD